MRVFGRVFLVLLLLGGIAAIGYGVWNAGYQQGLLETIESTGDVVVTVPSNPGWWGFGFFGLIFTFFFVFLLFGLFFKLAFGRRYWKRHMNGQGYEHYRSRMDEKLGRWHDEAHGRRAPPENDVS